MADRVNPSSGPKSREVMTDLFGADILELPYYPTC